MPRWRAILVCTLVFSLPAAMLGLLLWPVLLRRPVPNAMDQDAFLIVALALLAGAGMAMMFDEASRRRMER